MNTFVAYTVALDLIRALRPIVEQLRSYDSEMANQITHAGSGLVQCLGEGSRRSGKDPRRFYAMANGSASEIRAALDAAAAWGWIVDDSEARRLLDRELGLLWGLTHGRRSRAH